LKEKIRLLKSKKISGSLLQMTLIVSLIITLSLSMFLLHRYYLKQFFFSYLLSFQLHEDINSATLLIESEEALWPTNPRNILIENEGKVKCNLQDWGFYSIIDFETRKRNKQIRTLRMFGQDISRQDLFPSLYYSPKKKFLSVGGNTYLAGELYLPENGIQKATLEGKTYNRKLLHFGQVLKSSQKLPQIHLKWKDRIVKMQELDFSTYAIENVTAFTQKTINSFEENALLLSLDDVEQLRNIELRGKIIVRGGEKIVLDSTCNVEHCIVIANEIVFEKGFEGRGQFFARDHFQIEDSVQIKSPSILSLWNPESKAQMKIGSFCKIYADILVNAEAKKKTPVLEVAESAFCGQIYCYGMLQFQGTLFGSMYANEIVFLDHYFPVENYLYNTCIDATRLPREYVGISLFDIYVNRKYAETVF
jgi:hypothetical protein